MYRKPLDLDEKMDARGLFCLFLYLSTMANSLASSAAMVVRDALAMHIRECAAFHKLLC